MLASASAGSMAASISSALRAALSPVHLHLVDESFKHASGPGAESHFNVIIVSEKFNGVSHIARHRLVYEALAPLGGGAALPVHALAITAKTPAQWAASGGAIDPPATPACAGGGVH